MTLRECAIITAYTGILMGDFNEFHKYIEELLGRSVWTHELADINIQNLIKEKSKPDFIKLNQEAYNNQTTLKSILKENERLRNELKAIAAE